jgi:hypothetical protein
LEDNFNALFRQIANKGFRFRYKPSKMIHSASRLFVKYVTPGRITSSIKAPKIFRSDPVREARTIKLRTRQRAGLEPVSRLYLFDEERCDPILIGRKSCPGKRWELLDCCAQVAKVDFGSRRP